MKYGALGVVDDSAGAPFCICPGVLRAAGGGSSKFPLAQSALLYAGSVVARSVRPVSSRHAQPLRSKKTAEPLRAAQLPNTANREFERRPAAESPVVPGKSF
jgi:hypothetical protein